MPSPRRFLRAAAAAAAAVLTLGVTAGCDVGDLVGHGPVPPKRENASIILLKGIDGSTDAADVEAALGRLKVAKPASMTRYSREKFPHWRDASANGWIKAPNKVSNDNCDVRQATLIRDGGNVKYSGSCAITSGAWLDPYTGAKVTKTSDLDIDHMVPLANAWRSGASIWTTAQRTKYANSPLVTVTSGDSANQAKGDKGPEAWKPTNKESWCGYAIRWTLVKDQFHLTLNSESERTALTKMLSTCSVGTFQQTNVVGWGTN